MRLAVACASTFLAACSAAGSGPGPAIALEVDPTVVQSGATATVTWSSPGATRCEAAGEWVGAIPTAGTRTVTAGAVGLHRVGVRCSNGGGSGEALVDLVAVAPPTSRVVVPPPTRVSGCTGRCLWVDAASGSDANDGASAQRPLRTLQAAANAATPGTTVLVMSGVYGDSTSVPLTLIGGGGTADAWLVFAAAPGQHPVVKACAGPGPGQAIYLGGSAYVVIEGFEIVGDGATITPAEAAANDGSQARLNQLCVFVDGSGYPGFAPPVPHDIVIRHNVIHGCSGAGIYAHVADALTVAYNDVYDNGWWTVYGTGGMNLYHLADAPGRGESGGYANFVVGNRFDDNYNTLPWIGGNPPAIYDGNGVIIDDSNHVQPAISAHDVQGVPYTGRTYVANNVVSRSGGHGIHVFSSSHVDVVNNTAYANLNTLSRYLTWGEIVAQNADDVVFVNNVAVNANGKAVTHAGGQQQAYNVWAGASVPYLGPYDRVAEPLFVDAAHGDFTPGATSPALASGTRSLAPTRDLTGALRGDVVDLGAVQVTR